jgi:hypothetical protein
MQLLYPPLQIGQKVWLLVGKVNIHHLDPILKILKLALKLILLTLLQLQFKLLHLMKKITLR